MSGHSTNDFPNEGTSSDYFEKSHLTGSQSFKQTASLSAKSLSCRPSNANRKPCSIAVSKRPCGSPGWERKPSVLSRSSNSQILKPSEYADAAGTKMGRFVSQMVNDHPVVIFSKTSCPHCTETKTTLNDKGVPYKVVELDQMHSGEGPLVQNVLQEMTSARTVPRIFIDGNCVGGNSDLKTLNANGQLEQLLKSKKRK